MTDPNELLKAVRDYHAAMDAFYGPHDPAKDYPALRVQVGLTKYRMFKVAGLSDAGPTVDRNALAASTKKETNAVPSPTAGDKG